METESFLDELKRQLDRELPPEELKQMIYLMADKLGYDFQYCELPSQVVTFLENNMKRSKVISVLKHALAVMRFHGRFGTLSFADWIARYQASHVHLEDDNFVGRLGDIERICEMMKDDTYLGVWICGFGGVGKTTIAKEIGSRVTRHRDVDFLHVDLKEADTVADMFRSILRPLGHSSHDTNCEALQARVTSVILGGAQKETWILLDNIEDIYDQNKNPLDTFLGSLHGPGRKHKVKLLVTSRLSPSSAIPCLYEYKLGPLDDQSSLKFLRSSCKPAILQTSQYQTAMEYCGNIPLALVLLSSTISRGAASGDTEFNLRHIADSQEQIHDCIKYAYDRISDDLKKRLIQITVFDKSMFSVTDVAMVLDISQEEALWVLFQLCHNDMLQNAETTAIDFGGGAINNMSMVTCFTYFFHELLLRFVQQNEAMLSQEELSHCQNRFLELMFLRLQRCHDHYYENSRACVQYIQEHAHALRAFFKQLKPSLVMAKSLMECEHMQLASSVVMTTHFEKQQTIKYVQRMSDQTECRYFWEIEEVACSIDNGHFDKALSIISKVENDLLLIQTIPDRSKRLLNAKLYYQKGRLCRKKRDYSCAKDNLQKALDIYKDEMTGDPGNVSKYANVLNALGNVAYNSKEYDKALEFHTEAEAAMKRVVGDSTHHDVSLFKFNIGTIALAKARHIKNVGCLSAEEKIRVENLLALCLTKMDESIQDDYELGLHTLPAFADKFQFRSDVRREAGDLEGALSDAEEAKKIRVRSLEENNPKRMLADYKIGNVYLKMRERLSASSTEKRRELLRKAKYHFELVLQRVYDGDLTKDSEGIEHFLTDIVRLARATSDRRYLAYIDTICMRVRAGKNLDSSSESSSDSQDDLDTPSDDSESRNNTIYDSASDDSGVRDRQHFESQSDDSVAMYSQDEDDSDNKNSEGVAMTSNDSETRGRNGFGIFSDDSAAEMDSISSRHSGADCTEQTNPYPTDKMSSAKCLVCYNSQGASKSFKVGGNIDRASNRLDPDESPSYSAPHPDPSCLHMGLWSRSAESTYGEDNLSNKASRSFSERIDSDVTLNTEDVRQLHEVHRPKHLGSQKNATFSGSVLHSNGTPRISHSEDVRQLQEVHQPEHLGSQKYATSSDEVFHSNGTPRISHSDEEVRSDNGVEVLQCIVAASQKRKRGSDSE